MDGLRRVAASATPVDEEQEVPVHLGPLDFGNTRLPHTPSRTMFAPAGPATNQSFCEAPPTRAKQGSADGGQKWARMDAPRWQSCSKRARHDVINGAAVPRKNRRLCLCRTQISGSVEIFHHKSPKKSSTRSDRAALARWRDTETEHTDGQAAGDTFERRRQAGTGVGGEEPESVTWQSKYPKFSIEINGLAPRCCFTQQVKSP